MSVSEMLVFSALLLINSFFIIWIAFSRESLFSKVWRIGLLVVVARLFLM